MVDGRMLVANIFDASVCKIDPTSTWREMAAWIVFLSVLAIGMATTRPPR
jgi:hypothetical protein